MTNPFEAFACEHGRKPREERPAREKRAAPPPVTPQQKQEREKRDLAASYRKAKARELRELLEGQHGRNIVALRKFMRRLTIADADDLVVYVVGLAWPWEISDERRFLVRSMIAQHIRRIRERAGLHPYDDALDCFDEPVDASTFLLDFLNQNPGVCSVS